MPGSNDYEERTTEEWHIPASAQSLRTFNPIRDVVDRIEIPTSESKPVISLSIGDPSVFGNMDTSDEVVASVTKALKDKKNFGYPPSTGSKKARQAIAEKYTRQEAPLREEDVIICSGCSGALAIVMPTLANPGDNILLPKPGFSLYRTICGNSEIQPRFYDLLPHQQWEVDLKQADSLVDSRTRAILINNPSNPCGSNYSKQHLRDILAFAARHKLPVIADEIYADMVFTGEVFTPIATLTQDVPVIAVGGLAKRYLVPGWRVGWILVHDRKSRLKEVRQGMTLMSQVILGANSIVQAALPDILHKVDPKFHQDLNNQLEEQAKYFSKEVSTIRGLRPIVPQGAMYLMVEVVLSEFRDIKDDVDFSQKLLAEEHVFVLPGKCFMMNNFFRVVFCAPTKTLKEAADRIRVFAEKHAKI